MTTVATNRFVGITGRNERFDLIGSTPIYVDANDGNDEIVTDGGNDFLIGGLGDDVIFAVSGSDVIFGDQITGETPSDGNDSISSSGGNDYIWAGGGQDFVNGGSAADFVDGGSGADLLWGGSGADTLQGGAGADQIYGNGPMGGGSVSYLLVFAFDGATDSALAGQSNGAFFADADDSAADVLEGGAGNDSLFGNGGNDTLDGGADSDDLTGGAGADWLDGSSGMDYARYDASATGVVVRLDVGVGLNGDAQGDVLLSIEGLFGSAFQDFLIGANTRDLLFGQDGHDWLYGQGGDDNLQGGAGTDQILGGAGADLLYGGSGNDQFWFLTADFGTSVVDEILDWGGDGAFDYLRFEGLTAATLTILDGPGYVQVSLTDVVNSGTIRIFGTTVAALDGHVIFA